MVESGETFGIGTANVLDVLAAISEIRRYPRTTLKRLPPLLLPCSRLLVLLRQVCVNCAADDR